MGVLDQVTQLQNQGMGEEEIVSNLQQQGIAPKEITDAINQAKIKGAVADSGENNYMQEEEQNINAGGYAPQTQEMGQNAYVQQQAAPQEYYEEGAYNQGAAQPGMNSDMIIEIANQVFSEKSKKIQDKLDDMNEFKTLAQVKLEGMEDRLKRIEKMIDNLQIKILEEVGSYGNELEKTKKEVAMIEDTLSSKKSSSKKK
jgi:hypothetical protein